MHNYHFTFISFVLVRNIVAEDNSQLINLIDIFCGLILCTQKCYLAESLKLSSAPSKLAHFILAIWDLLQL